MSGARYPCVVESFGGTSAFLGHHLTLICAKVFEEGLYHLVSVAKVVLIELLDILLLNAVNDALYTYVGDGLFKVECLLKIICVRLEAEKFALGSVIFDGWIDRRWLNEVGSRSNGPACDGSIVDVIKNQCLWPMESATSYCFDRGNHLHHFFYHLVHGLGRRLSYNGIKQLCHHDEVDCHVDRRTSGWRIVHV
jgi:hypothetical protein